MAQPGQPLSPAGGGGPSASGPAAQQRLELGPGQLSRPEKVWSSSSTLIVGFYQAAPYSDLFKIFYKKSGSVFGTQVSLTPATILGPELAVRQPISGEAQYFEYEIKKLKPSTQYVIKVKTTDDAADVRSDKFGTISVEEERTRNNDMQNFRGALVKLGEYDGLVSGYSPESGIFAIRILQVEDLSQAVQLTRLNSEYSDSGLPVQAYTLSQIRFGHWGGEITGSKVVNESELKWLVARAVQVGDKSDAQAAFEARSRLLQAQVDKVTSGLEAQWSTKFRRLKLRAVLYLVLAALLAVGCSSGMWMLLRGNERKQGQLVAALGAAAERVADLEAQLAGLQLYKLSLDLDLGPAGSAAGRGVGAFGAFGGNRTEAIWSPAAGSHANASSSSAARGAASTGGGGEEGGKPGRRKGGTGGSSSSGHAGAGKRRRGAAGDAAPPSRGPGKQRSGYKQQAQTARRERGSPAAERQPRLYADGKLSPRVLHRALLRSHEPPELGAGAPAADPGRWGPGGEVPASEPDPWVFIQYVSNEYALHLQEWMKVQIGKAVRTRVNDMLAGGAPGSGGNATDAGAGGVAGSGAPGEGAEAEAESDVKAGPAARRGGRASSRGGSGGGEGQARGWDEYEGEGGGGEGGDAEYDDDDDDGGGGYLYEEEEDDSGAYV